MASTIFELAAQGAVDKLEHLLNAESDTDTDQVNQDGQTALQLAAKNGKAACVKLLIAAEADLNVADRLGNTALHYAVIGHHAECARELISAGADTSIHNSFGQSAAQLAAQRNFGDMALILRPDKDNLQWHAPQPSLSPFVVRAHWDK